MVVYVVTIKVKPECIDPFIRATEANHLATRKESGNRRFDLIQNQKIKGDFILYEVYEDEQAVDSHKQTGHYLQWREEVASFMATDRTGICYNSIFPSGERQW